MLDTCNFHPIINEFKINKLLKVSEITEMQIPSSYGIAFKDCDVRVIINIQFPGLFESYGATEVHCIQNIY
jgi:hypothetical protein